MGVMDRMEQRISNTVAKEIEKQLLKNKKESDAKFEQLLNNFEAKLEEMVDAKIKEKIFKM